MRTRDWPEPLAADAYERVRERYLDRLFATGAVRAAYQVGGVAAPGLSDLDLVLVCEPGCGGRLRPLADVTRLDDETRYVLMHGQFFVDADVFARLRALFQGSDLRLVRGEPFPVHEHGDPVASVLGLAFHVDAALRRFVDFTRVRDSRGLHVRRVLAWLHALRFNVEAAASWGAAADHRPFVDDVLDLRRAWFDLPRDDAISRLRAAVERAPCVLASVLATFAGAAACMQGTPGTGAVSVLETNEVQRYGPHAPSVRLRKNPLARLLPAPLRRVRPFRTHALPVAEALLPAPLFAFPAIEAECLRRLDAPRLAARVRGAPPDGVAAPLRAAMEERARALIALHRFLERERLRGASQAVVAGWRQRFPSSARIRARLLRALLREHTA